MNPLGASLSGDSLCVEFQASTGLRISEALGLRFADVTADGLLIRKTKFGKSRLVPLHDSAAAGLQRYLMRRRQHPADGDHVFIGKHGRPLPYHAVQSTFLTLLRTAGLWPARGGHRPRLHDLRHYSGNRIIPATESRGRLFGGMSHSPSHTWRNNQRGRQKAQNAIVGVANESICGADAKALGSVIASPWSVVLTPKRAESAALSALCRALLFLLAHA